MYKTKVTSQGTISIPSALRRKYKLAPGDILSIEDSGKLVLSKASDFALLRKKNQAYTKNATPYQSGDGFAAHIKEKYDT